MMNRTLTLCAAAVTVLLAQWLPQPSLASRETGATDTAAQRIRAHVGFLADDLLEGRLAGTRGYDLAANYVAAQFAAIGLEPAAIDGGWFQNLNLIEASAVVPAAQLQLRRGDESQTLTVTEDFLPAADVNGAESEVTAPLVFAGFGVHAPQLGHDDFAGVDLRGKIAVVINGAPDRFSSIERAHHSATLTKYPELVRRGAIGVITFLTPADTERNPWQRSVQSSWRPRMRWVDTDGLGADSFPELRAACTLSPAGVAKLFAGAARPLPEVLAAVQRGGGQGFDFGVTATLKRRSLLGRRQSANVLGVLRGADRRLADEYIVVTAHLDHLGKGAAVNGDAIYNGAVDNATGIGVLLEMARQMATATRRPRRSVLFAAVTGEEAGLLGSDYLARHPPFSKGRYVANINIDMPVMLAEIADLVAFGAEHTSMGAIAARAAQAEGLALTPDPMPEETIFVRSDQYSFVRQGVPAIYLDNGILAAPRVPRIDARAQFQRFLRETYHQPSDQIDQTIHYPSLARLARVNARIVTDVANNSAPPAWTPGSFLGAIFARRPAS